MNLTKNLILASNSPRRKEILAAAGFKFEIISRPISEDFDVNLKPEFVPLYLSKTKAECFADFDKNNIILCADTIVILNNKIFNKPENETEAAEMLQNLSGKTHEVITGVCLKIGDDYETFSDKTLVTFDTISKHEIEYYIKNYKPLDKAGSYGVQDFIGMIGIKKIEGSFYNVMGLPIHKVYEHLKKYVSF